jgi:transposase-like protein
MPTDEEKKGRPREFGFNPITRRWVKRTSDVWLRLVKSGLVDEDPELMEEITAKRRQANLDRKNAIAATAATAMAHQVNPAPKPAPTPKPKPVAPKPEPKPDRAEVRRRVIQTALDNQSELDGCQDDYELEERLRRLLWDTHTRGCRGEAPMLAPSAKPRRAARQRACAESDEETSDY